MTELVDLMIDGRPATVSGSVPTGVAVFGDWSGAVLATFGVLEIGINRTDNASVLFKMGAAAIRVLWSVDTAILRAKSFYSLTSVS